MRRTHSTIDSLPAKFKDTITRMIVDDAWPDDWAGETDGKPRYEDIVKYGKLKGHKLSKSAVGRYGMRLRSITKMKNAGLVVKDIMSDLDEDSITETQKAAAQMITAQLIDLVANADKMTSKEIKEVSQAIQSLTNSLIQSDKHLGQQIAAKAALAVEEVEKKTNLDKKTLKIIREQIYGIVK